MAHRLKSVAIQLFTFLFDSTAYADGTSGQLIMPGFSLRGLILVAIAAILILRTIRKFGAKRSNTLVAPRGTTATRNAFCTNCGAALQGGGLFCGGCGTRRP